MKNYRVCRDGDTGNIYASRWMTLADARKFARDQYRAWNKRFGRIDSRLFIEREGDPGYPNMIEEWCPEQ